MLSGPFPRQRGPGHVAANGSWRLAANICRRIHAAALHAGLGDGFSGHSPRIGMAQDLDIANFHPTPIMTAGRWKTIRMVAHYTKEAEAARGAVSQFHQRTI